MTTFRNGPAKGVLLALHRAVVFLRVTRKKGTLEAWDALDQPDDKPQDDEELFAYRIASFRGQAHMRFGGKAKHASGFYAMAEYEFCDPQPDDATMRDFCSWADWTKANDPREKGQPS